MIAARLLVEDRGVGSVRLRHESRVLIDETAAELGGRDIFLETVVGCLPGLLVQEETVSR